MSVAVPTLLAVWAHPDDEAYLAAGLLASAADAGWRVVVATATRGEFGTDVSGARPPDHVAVATTTRQPASAAEASRPAAR